jgi:hypothetical protein
MVCLSSLLSKLFMVFDLSESVNVLDGHRTMMVDAPSALMVDAPSVTFTSLRTTLRRNLDYGSAM